MLRIAICDDQTEFTEHLYKLIKESFAKYDYGLAGIQIYQNGHTLLQDYDTGTKFDIIFLDIEMPPISGMEVADKIRKMDSDVFLIFVTNFSDFMRASFKVEAFDFLEKPISQENIDEVLTRCIRKYEQQHGHIVVKTNLGMATLYLNHVIYIKSDLHYVTFVLLHQKGPIRSKMTLNEVQQLLHPFQQFIRCHQSYIVNLDYVQEITPQKLFLSINDLVPMDYLPISRKYTASVKKQFLLFNLKTGRFSS